MLLSPTLILFSNSLNNSKNQSKFLKGQKIILQLEFENTLKIIY